MGKPQYLLAKVSLVSYKKSEEQSIAIISAPVQWLKVSIILKLKANYC